MRAKLKFLCVTFCPSLYGSFLYVSLHFVRFFSFSLSVLIPRLPSNSAILYNWICMLNIGFCYCNQENTFVVCISHSVVGFCVSICVCECVSPSIGRFLVWLLSSTLFIVPRFCSSIISHCFHFYYLSLFLSPLFFLLFSHCLGSIHFGCHPRNTFDLTWQP